MSGIGGLPNRRTVRDDLSRRFLLVMAAALLSVLGATTLIYVRTNDSGREQQVRDANAHFASRTADLDLGWRIQADIFRAQLEFNRLLESPDHNPQRMTAFLASMGGQQIFTHVTVLDPKKGPIYRYNTRSQEILELPREGAGGGGLSWVYGPADQTVYRAIEQRIWMGAAGSGRLILYVPLDSALLQTIAFPGTQLSLRWQGRAIAARSAQQTAVSSRKAERVVESVTPWSGGPGGPEVVSAKDYVPPLPIAETLTILLVTGVLLVLLAQVVLGRGLKDLGTRLQTLGRAAENFGEDRIISAEISRALGAAVVGKTDEVSRLTGDIGTMMDAIQRADAQLRESAAFNTAVLNSLSEQVAVLDQHGVIVNVNAAWRDFAKSNGAPESVVNPIGVNYLELCERAAGGPRGDDAAAAWSGIKAVMLGEQREFVLEYAGHAPHEQRWFQMRVTSLQGWQPGVVISHLNVTARYQAEAAHSFLEAQLRESQKMQAIGTLAGGIAHDFNNALATILGNLELARQDTVDNQPVQESLKEIHKAASRARNLVQQILAFSRRQPAEHKRFDVAEVALEAAQLLRATVPARLSLDVHCASGVPHLLGNATQIEQVLINLGTNAMQAMPSGPGRIEIRLDTVVLDAELARAEPALGALQARHPGPTVRLSVSDTGVGMDAAIRERIFEPFFTTKPVNEGTGLGLSVVHGIVQGHDGEITVQSEPGKGSTFTIYLPLVGAPEAASADKTPVAVATPAFNPKDRQRILYLDDDESLVLLVRRLLERRGFQVSAYLNQEEALEFLRANSSAFDLVLSDYNMPGMSGLDVAREVRAIRADLPVAVASGFIDEELQTQADNAGVRELISKGDDVDQFCAVIQRLIRSATSLRDRIH